MDMPDKEFDDLFRSKLNDIEIQPSARVWEGVEGGLNAGRRKKLFVPFLSIAASIIVLVAAWILSIPKNNVVKVKQQVKMIAKSAKPANGPLKLKTVTKAILIQAPVIQDTSARINRLAGVYHGKINKVTTIKSAAVLTDTTKSSQPYDQGRLAANTPQQPEVTAAVVPDSSTPFAIKDPVKENSAFTQPTVTTAQLPLPIKNTAAPVKTKHKIRSLGDLVNAVVAKVDKRKDKIIEFTDTDGDESNVTGVNLGIIRIKKEDK